MGYGILRAIAEVVAADREFLALFHATAELAPDDPAYASYLSFNASAVERGRALVEELASHVSIPGSRALHIGAGSGGVSIALAEAGAMVTAIEPDELRFRWAQTRIAGHGHDVRLVACPPERIPCPDAMVDLVVIDDAIEHVTDPTAVLSEIARVLTLDGVAYIVVPNKMSLLHIRRDPHFRMLGVVWMPRRLGAFYVERIRRHARRYWVNKIPTKRWLSRRAAAAGLRLELLPLEALQKLRDPDQIADRHRHMRVVVRAANRARVTPLLERAATGQAPYLRFLAVKAPTKPTRASGSNAD